ncbi:hypothetical protein L7F22_004265 [Adiantum nelumboides]|nr:hypothetical protein [Adiantum nelumboides]
MSFPTFNGAAGEDAQEFLDNLEIACLVTGRDDDATRLRVFPLLMKAKAKAWFNTLLPANRGDWAGLRVLFLAKFGGGGETSESLWGKVCELRQGSLFEYNVYEVQFVELWERWVASLRLGEAAPDFLKKDRFVAGLCPPLREKVKGRFPVTWMDARDIARLKERKIRYQLQQREADQEEEGMAPVPPTNAPAAHRGQGNQDQQELLNRITHQLEDLSVHLVRGGRAPPPNQEQARGPRRQAQEYHCYNCGENGHGKCDISQGEWVPNTGSLPYTSDTCQYIQQSRQNCVRNGRPDSDYLHWKWKPSECELPPFNSAYFLDLMRGKKLAFIGDSLGRNHMESLLCVLTQLEDPLSLPSDRYNEFMWHFPSYNFTFGNIWSPFLVNYTEEDDLIKLNLDIPDVAWAQQLADYNVVVISTGYWYHRRSLYYVNNTVLGANSQLGLNVTIMQTQSAIRLALANVLKHMTMEYTGIIMLRTVTVDHFEGEWMKGGSCKRKKPYSHQGGGKPPVPWMNKEICKVQIEEFQKAMAYANDTSKLKLLNVTYSAFLRPDGHPGPYRMVRYPNDTPNDCLHWCLPGPIDLWNQFVLHSITLGS